MNIPNSVADAFMAAQKDMFEDSTIAWHLQLATVNTRGTTEISPNPTAAYTYTDCNVTVISDDADVTAWGLVSGKDIRVVRSYGLPDGTGDFVLWNGKFYRVKHRTKPDLYDEAYCELWQKG